MPHGFTVEEMAAGLKGLKMAARLKGLKMAARLKGLKMLELSLRAVLDNPMAISKM